MASAQVVIHSDSGTASTFYAKAAGIIESIAPGTDAVDASQGFYKGDVAAVAAYLYTTVPFWPEGTVFLSFVGQGRAVAVRLKGGSVIISPDNGAATMCIDLMGFDSARLIDTERFGSDGWESARCAATLASGTLFTDIGEEIGLDEVVLLRKQESRIEDGLAEGEVSMLLRNFGNITFSIGTDEFEKTGIATGDEVEVTFQRNGEVQYRGVMTYQPSFGYVPEGAPVIFNGSSGYMDIGLNMRSFIEECIPQILDADDPSEFKVRIEKRR